MLEPHAPHQPVHTWKDAFIHIGIIAVGLLLAIGLEQTVEYFHRRHQVHQAEQAIYNEAVENRYIAQRNFAHIDQARRVIRLNMAALEQAQSSHASQIILLPFMHETYLYSMSNTAWLTLRDNGLLSLVPEDRTHFWWGMDYVHAITVSDNDAVIRLRQDVQALIHLHDDPSQLSAEERERLLLAFGALDEALTEMRNDLQIFGVGNNAILAGRALSPEEGSTIFTGIDN